MNTSTIVVRAKNVRKGDLVDGKTITHVIEHPSGIALLSFGTRVLVGLNDSDCVDVIR